MSHQCKRWEPKIIKCTWVGDTTLTTHVVEHMLRRWTTFGGKYNYTKGKSRKTHKQKRHWFYGVRREVLSGIYIAKSSLYKFKRFNITNSQREMQKLKTKYKAKGNDSKGKTPKRKRVERATKSCLMLYSLIPSLSWTNNPNLLFFLNLP